MKIAHVVGRSRVRYTPARIATYWGRYTEHEGAAFSLLRKPVRGKERRYRDFLCPYGFYCVAAANPRKTFRDFIEDCDVIHFHDDAYPSMIEKYGIRLDGKSMVYHAHIGTVIERFFNRAVFRWDRRVKHACITNGYGHMFDQDEKSKGRKWHRLPDIIDLNHPDFLPPKRPAGFWEEKPLRVVYTYSNEREGGKINAKRPGGHQDRLRGIPGVKYIPVHGKPFGVAMAEKKRAHIVLDEVFSPYVHLSTLEGAAIGACVVTRFNDYTRDDLNRYLGASGELPFVSTSQELLADAIKTLRDDRKLLRGVANHGREWMLKHYGTEKLLRRYLELYST